MDKPAHQSETEDRRSAMLRTAFCSVVREALEAPDTIEIMANPDGSVWIEKAGIGLIISEHTLPSSDRERVIRLVASGVGVAANRTSPIISAELPGSGERFEGLLPPVSTAPCFSIRKPATTPFELGDYVTQGALAPALAQALKDAIATHANILIAGGTSSGKTTFTNALLAEPSLHDDRIVILEDTRELRCAAPNVVQLRTHRGSTSLQDLVRSTLRLRPDRIIIGEVRGAEALDLLKAWNTGHPGGITTLHANSAHGALARLEQLTLEATPRAPFDLIAEAIDVVVFMSRAGGQRRVEEALRVTGFDGEGYQTQPLVSRSLSLVQHGETL
ncbi:MULTISPECIES: P-type conjugative transfer ATPase TrbB [Hyphomonas]|mgnify:FL=1|jgi:type IV secretion system protein VirB11|uniref:Conjugal transfer protein TrbB n=4 Tax=Hyphomonas TaxID=85 RepID=A0A059E7T9_9PROT|nr:MULTISPECIES: P-type conjugative transfer ATPase TrbB [Hyphomonas]MAN90288.1 P-type conjugative transfer ATPase TrbB [Hyphomonadaceae bacterium]MEE2929618.1 P-type conjugative transfer ATPase TrbB [Pseudomonadota bacterium]KCZ63660.1 conjugal transfer protein TrbB [Hyphomonas atlantica]MAL46454.1 P-type conjugative transfer ATPase TrbB [Hyphomonas sp.]MBG66719.1 P-type conjugative transfer ATPase TrbB [Hyphomonas sp.]|tara:strand:- start:5917 stop:6912 length:996 start_codon:yes stop_codon:yes gene_type:complete